MTLSDHIRQGMYILPTKGSHAAPTLKYASGLAQSRQNHSENREHVILPKAAVPRRAHGPNGDTASGRCERSEGSLPRRARPSPALACGASVGRVRTLPQGDMKWTLSKP